jgi:hypothetical protein
VAGSTLPEGADVAALLFWPTIATVLYIILALFGKRREMV